MRLSVNANQRGDMRAGRGLAGVLILCSFPCLRLAELSQLLSCCVSPQPFPPQSFSSAFITGQSNCVFKQPAPKRYPAWLSQCRRLGGTQAHTAAAPLPIDFRKTSFKRNTRSLSPLRCPSDTQRTSKSVEPRETEPLPAPGNCTGRMQARTDTFHFIFCFPGMVPRGRGSYAWEDEEKGRR